MKKYINYKDIEKDSVKFITIAEYGAMGDSGGIELLSYKDNKFTLYTGNMYYGEKIMDMDEFYEAFAEFNKTRCFMGMCGGLNKNWEYIYLGYGNNLFISRDIYDYFKILLDSFPTSHIISKWKSCAVKMFALLDSNYTEDKTLLIEQNKEFNCKLDFDNCSYDEIQKLHVEYAIEYGKSYEEVSLNKIDNQYNTKITKVNNEINTKKDGSNDG